MDRVEPSRYTQEPARLAPVLRWEYGDRESLSDLENGTVTQRFCERGNCRSFRSHVYTWAIRRIAVLDDHDDDSKLRLDRLSRVVRAAG